MSDAVCNNHAGSVKSTLECIIVLVFLATASKPEAENQQAEATETQDGVSLPQHTLKKVSLFFNAGGKDLVSKKKHGRVILLRRSVHEELTPGQKVCDIQSLVQQ